MNEKSYSDTKIEEIIDQYGGSRFQFAIFAYILDVGILKLKTYTEEQILAIKGRGLLSDEMVQGVARCAAGISKQCGTYGVLEYISKYF